MGEVAYSTRQEPEHSVEIVVHVDETLGEEKRTELVSALEKNEGIVSAEFCPLRYHLMLVRYNRDVLNSQDVLGKVNGQDVHAELIGPV
jgi:phosphoribosyl-ATP pyrophosphohydrolase